MCELDYLTADQAAAEMAERAEHQHLQADFHNLSRLVAELVTGVGEMAGRMAALEEEARGWLNPIYGQVSEVKETLGRLEAEFAPLARKYGRVADRLPGAGWRGRNGQPPRPI